MKRGITVWTYRAAGTALALMLVVPARDGAQSQTQKPDSGTSSKFDEPVKLQPIERFKGSMILRSAKKGATGAQAEMQVALQNWMIPNRQRVEQVPESGFLLIQVRSGEDVVTVINGERLERKAEEFFTVPAGAKFAVETGNDSAILQVFSIRAGGKSVTGKK